MNKEEFKLRILSQLKDKDPAIHAIMLNTGIAHLRYWYKKTFLVREYNLEMTIETINHQLPAFQVIFRDAKPNTKYEYELNPDSYLNEMFTRENLFIKHDEVFFELEVFCITQRDYTFSFTDLGLPKTIRFVISWSYNLSTGEFVYNDDPEDDEAKSALDFATTMDSHRKNQLWSYIEAMVDNDFMNKLDDTMKTLGVPEIRKQMITHVFNNTRATSEHSALSSIIRALHSVL